MMEILIIPREVGEKVIGCDVYNDFGGMLRAAALVKKATGKVIATLSANDPATLEGEDNWTARDVSGVEYKLKFE